MLVKKHWMRPRGIKTQPEYPVSKTTGRNAKT
jgi:hypothetical protein